MAVTGDRFKVTPEDVTTAASNCDTTAANLDAQLASLKNYVVALEGTWQGIAATTFSSLMTDYDTYSRMMHDALTDIASGLRGNYVNYTDAETANINSLQTVNGSIPGGAGFR